MTYVCDTNKSMIMRSTYDIRIHWQEKNSLVVYLYERAHTCKHIYTQAFVCMYLSTVVARSVVVVCNSHRHAGREFLRLRPRTVDGFELTCVASCVRHSDTWTHVYITCYVCRLLRRNSHNSQQAQFADRCSQIRDRKTPHTRYN